MLAWMAWAVLSNMIILRKQNKSPVLHSNKGRLTSLSDVHILMGIISADLLFSYVFLHFTFYISTLYYTTLLLIKDSQIWLSVTKENIILHILRRQHVKKWRNAISIHPLNAYWLQVSLLGVWNRSSWNAFQMHHRIQIKSGVSTRGMWTFTVKMRIRFINVLEKDQHRGRYIEWYEGQPKTQTPFQRRGRVWSWTEQGWRRSRAQSVAKLEVLFIGKRGSMSESLLLNAKYDTLGFAVA